jgi:hypothetical protein
MFGPKRMKGVQVLREQALAWMEDYRGYLASRGLGFTADDLRVIGESRAVHTGPTAETVGFGTKVGMYRALVKTIFTGFPVTGIMMSDPRLTPVSGISLVTYAVAARAIGWSSDDALTDRVLLALGVDPADWKPAMDGWTERLTDDMQVATLYGQLYEQAEPLPRHPAG